MSRQDTHLHFLKNNPQKANAKVKTPATPANPFASLTGDSGEEEEENWNNDGVAAAVEGFKISGSAAK